MATVGLQEIDYYEVLQVSPNAELDTIQRIYRILAQRFHPDNQITGDAERFRQITEANETLSDPQRRARYDVGRPERDQQRARLIADAIRAQTAVEGEQLLRLTVLEILYAKRRLEPNTPGIFEMDLEGLVGRPREHLQFTLWYLSQRGLVTRSDDSRLVINAAGVDHLEEHCGSGPLLRRLAAANA